MDNFNLDITKYSCEDLIELLNLSNEYNESNILEAKKNLQHKLIKMDNADLSKVNDILFFLDNAQNKLIQRLQNINVTGTYEDTQNNVTVVGDHVIINSSNETQGKKAKTWDGKNVEENIFPPGYLNPINIKTIKKAINVDTRFRPEYFLTKSSDFTVTLPERVNKVVSMRLSSIELPMTYYALSENLQNTTFKITLSPPLIGPGPTEFIVKLPPGNYEDRWTNSTDAAFIESAVNSALARVGLQNSTGDSNDCVYKFTIDPVSGRSVFGWEARGSDSITYPTVKINFNVNNEGKIDNTTPLMFRLGWQLGFRAGVYDSSIDTASSSHSAYVSEGVCFINGPRYIYLAINDYNNSSNNFFTAAFSESILSPHILGRFNVTKGMQESKVFKTGQNESYTESLNRTREYFGPVDIQRLSIQLLDEFGRVIDLNNMDWSFVLSFVCLYD